MTKHNESFPTIYHKFKCSIREAAGFWVIRLGIGSMWRLMFSGFASQYCPDVDLEFGGCWSIIQKLLLSLQVARAVATQAKAAVLELAAWEYKKHHCKDQEFTDIQDFQKEMNQPEEEKDRRLRRCLKRVTQKSLPRSMLLPPGAWRRAFRVSSIIL